MADQKKLNKIKSTVLMRGLSLAKMTINTSAQLASHGVSSLFSSADKKQESWKELLKGQARILSNELGELKGSLMKAGQMLSMYGEHFLPAEANEMLKSLQAESPALEWPAIEKELKKNLSAEKLAELEIDHEPVGSASLGQVHRARIKQTDEWLALKIQYPGVKKAIDSDLKALKSIFGLLKLLPRGNMADHLFAEVRDMLMQETDYQLEAEETETYRKRLQDDPRFVVPRVYREYCGRQVLATSYEKGHRPDEPLILNLSQERRNRLSLAFLDLYFRELFDWGIVQTDPHLGNYRVRLSPSGQDQLVLLDFGAVRKYPKEFLDPYYRMVSAAYFNNTEELNSAALELRFLTENDSPALRQLFEDFCLMTVEPFLSFDDPRNHVGQIQPDGSYDWGSSDLPQRLTKKVFQMIQRFELRPPPREILFLDRKTGGVFVFLKVLGAHINARDLLLSYLRR
ncbi:MAG: ABC transporter [Bdellovibrio sp.]|nr:MAG: ABC transporter [Bdellovibrio sp.]